MSTGARLMADLMRDFGLSREQAAGVVGNLAHESGNFETLQEISPLVEGSRGGYGYAQWTGPRRRAFEEWARGRGLDPSSYDANYGFLQHELTNTPEGAVLGDLRGAQSAQDAAMIFSDKFLRPGIPHHDSRIALASQYAGMDVPANSPAGFSSGQPVNALAAVAPQEPERQTISYDNALNVADFTMPTMAQNRLARFTYGA